MVRSIISLGITAALAAISAVDATTVAVMELGKGGCLHKVDASMSETSSYGVMSFMKSTHDAGKNGKRRENSTTQIPGMGVVPDLFNRADGGVVVGISGESVDLESMPTVASIVEENGAVAHLNVPGRNGRKLMMHLGAERVDSSTFSAAVDSKAQAALSEEGNKIESLSVNVDDQDAAASVDASLGRMLKTLAADAEKAGSTVIVHLVIDNDDNIPSRRLAERQLEDNNNNNNNNGDNNNNAQDFEIPGYYDENTKTFVTPFKTIYQIQYYNVVLWTAVGLSLLLIVANAMTMNMPLMPDTLLFGESAKMVAE
eukprot:CAMPEP_0197246784 /NCGR_PEP_ID=MMETSP1429-20130617/22593_1 /TAXON_ID=49237 /ORGANISM="Chaetoceros  sp., Strain UNC1202" /LENGTH=313 /DNA_ID=CAMNT_0042707529 /DNA_START=28 /DNA_END=969 /DNA_ORIENTATION=+